MSACRAAEDHSCAQYGTFQVKERRAGDFEFWKSLPAGGANPHSPWVESDHVPYHTNERIPFANAPPPLPWWEHPKAPQMQNLLFYGGKFSPDFPFRVLVTQLQLPAKLQRSQHLI